MKPKIVREFRKVDGLDYREKKFPGGQKGGAFRDVILNIWGNADGWALGHAMNGLLWGKILSGLMVLAHNANPTWGASLKPETLLDLRIFNPDREFRIWRTDNGLKGCMVSESSDKPGCLACDEKQIFIAGKRLGDPVMFSNVTFSLVEGPSGQCQAIPVDWDGEQQTCRLWVRHYAHPRSNGMLRIAESRLLKIDKK